MSEINERFVADAREYYSKAFRAIEAAQKGDPHGVGEAIDHSHTALLDLIEWAEQVTRYLKEQGVNVVDSPID